MISTRGIAFARHARSIESGMEHSDFGDFFDHLDVATSNNNLGYVYQQAGLYEKALEYAQKSYQDPGVWLHTPGRGLQSLQLCMRPCCPLEHAVP